MLIANNCSCNMVLLKYAFRKAQNNMQLFV